MKVVYIQLDANCNPRNINEFDKGICYTSQPHIQLLVERKPLNLLHSFPPFQFLLSNSARTSFISQKKSYVKNRSVCKNALTKDQYGSCTLLLMGSCHGTFSRLCYAMQTYSVMHSKKKNGQYDSRYVCQAGLK